MPRVEGPGEMDELERFVTAQAPVIEQVLAELRNGRKRTHWMWFVFPQLRGLGRSAMAQRYGIASLKEARAYLAHPVLGPRLGECSELAIAADAPALDVLFPPPDDLKFRSSMTLFAHAAGDPNSVFARALERWCGGQPDPATLALLK